MRRGGGGWEWGVGDGSGCGGQIPYSQRSMLRNCIINGNDNLLTSI